MKKTLSTILATLTLAFIGSCTKPDTGSENTPVTPPDTEQKEEEPKPAPAPVLKSFTTSYGDKIVTGDNIVLSGTDFSEKTNGNVVLFDDLACTDIIEVSATRLVARIPGITGKERLEIKVSTAAGTSNGLTADIDTRRCDSAEVFKNAKVEQLREGVSWASTLTTWKGEPRSINIVTISPSEIKNLHFTYPNGMQNTSTQCSNAGALVGINGQYFDNSSGGTGLARDFLKIDGTVATPGTDGRSVTFASGAFVFTDGIADIKSVSGNEKARELTDANAMVCGPILIDNGKYCYLSANTTHNTDTHPRTAVAITYSGHILLVTIDGRFPGKAVGMSTQLMQEFFTMLGARSALNLDGGGSTTMYIKGRGMVNHACDGSNWDNPRERAVNSIIYLK